MSQELIESLRKALSVANDDGMEAATAEFGHLLHPDFGIEEAAGVPDPGTFTGREAFVANLRKLEERSTKSASSHWSSSIWAIK